LLSAVIVAGSGSGTSSSLLHGSHSGRRMSFDDSLCVLCFEFYNASFILRSMETVALSEPNIFLMHSSSASASEFFSPVPNPLKSGV